MESFPLAEALAEQALAKARNKKLDSAYAFGYLTGTLLEALRMLTPEQREVFAKQLR